MATLHVRSVPDDLYTHVQELARLSNRSLSAQVVTMLYTAVEEEDNRQQQGETLHTIRHRRFKAPANTPISSELLREDRQR